MTGMQVVVDGLVTQYALTGKGKLIVMLHGWGDDSRTFATLQTELSSHYQVLAFDLPGFGGTQPPQEVWGLDGYAAFVSSVLAKLNFGKLYAIIGHSNGGAVAIRGIAVGRLQPQKLILLAASGIRDRGSLRRLGLKVVAKSGKAATVWLPRRYKRALRQRLYGAAGSDMLVVPQLQETFKRSVRQDVQTDAARLTLPTLLIYAANDRAVPARDGQRYHQLIRHSRLEVLTDAAHFVHHDQPAKVYELIEEFLR